MCQDNTNEHPSVKTSADLRTTPAPPARSGVHRTLSGAILVGGRSRRMGADKALLRAGGRTLLERARDALRPFVQRVALVGAHPAADTLPDVVRLDDWPAARGPIAGILAALVHDPASDWLVVGCDMPAVGREAIEWLLARHRQCLTDARPDAPGDPPTATLGRLPDRPEPEPLLAVYTPAAIPLLRAAAESGDLSMRGVIRRLGAGVHPVPPAIAPQWFNVNTPEDWRTFLARIEGGVQ